MKHMVCTARIHSDAFRLEPKTGALDWNQWRREGEDAHGGTVLGRCDETPHRAHRVHRTHRTTSRRERQVTGRFAPS